VPRPLSRRAPHAWLLGDGGYLIGSSSGVFKAVKTSPNVFSFTQVSTSGDGQYINPIPEPGTLAAGIALAGLTALRRRRAPSACC
jgi:hypothetical protein